MSATKRHAEQAGVIPASNRDAERPDDYDPDEEARIRWLIEQDRQRMVHDAEPLGWEAKF